ncbi:uncharacterized protein LOC132565546 [Ylistrum balloti]|uniref:uncharacterized protein LOC132565546 n=1 Tax=Ylistrum balloti TaxID=509963 RepID=UPI002905DA1F|nr:uncharacterized protein LOC132565546 [Ylistrum balloti]
MMFVLWISLGLNFFTSAPSQPWLPPNPTDKCLDESILYTNTTSFGNWSTNSNDTIFSSSNLSVRIAVYNQEMEVFTAYEPQGLDKLYSVSFRWFGTIGCVMAIALGAFVSYITGHPSAEEVDVRYILPLGDQVFPYLPKKARQYLEFGVDFGKRKRWLEQLEDTKQSELAENLNVEVEMF